MKDYNIMIETRRLVVLKVFIIVSMLFCMRVMSFAGVEQTDAQAAYTSGSNLEAVGYHSQAITAWQTISDDENAGKALCANAKLAIGQAYLAMGQTGNAQQQFHGVIAEYPEFKRQCAEAALGLARIQEESGEYGQAITSYTALRASYPDMSRQCAEAMLRMAACHAALGQQDQQVIDLSTMFTDHPEDHERGAEARVKLGQILIAKGRMDEAIVEFDKIIPAYGELDIWCAEALLWKASALQKGGKGTEALACYQKVITDYQSLRPQRLKAMLKRGSILEQSGQTAEALAEYGTLLQNYSEYRNQAEVVSSRVTALLSSASLPADTVTNSRNALSSYEQAKAIGTALGDAEQDMAEKAGVEVTYARLRKERVETLMGKGSALRALGRYQESKDHFRKVANEYGDTEAWTIGAKIELGKTERAANLLPNALATFADVIATGGASASGRADAHIYRAEIYEQLGDTAKAIVEYRAVTQGFASRKGRCGTARLQLGVLLKKSGDANGALLEFAALFSDPTMLPEHVLPAVESAMQTLTSQKKFRDAVAAADVVAANYQPAGRWRSRVLFLKAMAQCDARWYPDAQMTLKQLIGEHPNDPATSRQAQMLLAQSLLERGEKQDEARALLQSMLSGEGWSREDKAQMTEYMGFSYPKNSSDAETWFTKGISEYAGTLYGDDCYFHRSLCRTARKAFPDALADIGMMRDSYLRHYALAECYAAQGRASEAAAEYERVYPNLPADFHGSYFEPYAAYVKLVELYKTLGDDAKASIASQRMQEMLTEHMLPAQ